MAIFPQNIQHEVQLITFSSSGTEFTGTKRQSRWSPSTIATYLSLHRCQPMIEPCSRLHAIIAYSASLLSNADRMAYY